jgi:hypothetical protein
MKTFAEVVDSADALSRDEQEELIRILQSRLREERRVQLVADVKAAETEFASGKGKAAMPAEIMRRLRK